MYVLKYSLLPIGLLLALWLPAQTAHQLQRKGDKAYQRSDYQEAEQAYREAETQKPGDPALKYNTGNALYRQGNYEAAESFFNQAAQAAKAPNKQADAWHNLGNSYLMQKKYQEAADAYEKSLRARPGDPDSKVNLQFAKKKLKQQQQEQQQQQQNQQNQSDNPSPQDQQDPQNQSPGQQNQPPGEQQQPSQNNPTAPQSQERLSPEQARQLLETAVAPADKQNARKYREQEPGKHQVTPKKDW